MSVTHNINQGKIYFPLEFDQELVTTVENHSSHSHVSPDFQVTDTFVVVTYRTSKWLYLILSASVHVLDFIFWNIYLIITYFCSVLPYVADKALYKFLWNYVYWKSLSSINFISGQWGLSYNISYKRRHDVLKAWDSKLRSWRNFLINLA